MRVHTATLGALILATAASAQYAFELADQDENSIYTDIMVAWKGWAAAGNGVLASAKDDYPDAYAQLTAVYGTTSLPGLFNEGLARNAAKRLAGVSETTIWDKGQASAQGEFTFSTTELSATSGGSHSATATGSATKTPMPTSGGHGSATSGGDATSDGATTGEHSETNSGDQTDQTDQTASSTHATSATGTKTGGTSASHTGSSGSGAAAGSAAGQLIAAVVAAAVVAVAF